jgi:hypothetical protein
MCDPFRQLTNRKHSGAVENLTILHEMSLQVTIAGRERIPDCEIARAILEEPIVIDSSSRCSVVVMYQFVKVAPKHCWETPQHLANG